MGRTDARLVALALVVAMHPVTAYAHDVLEGRVVACRYVKLACRRHMADLKRQSTASFPYHFDEARADHAIAFVEQLRHTKGKWASRYGGRDTRIRLEPWQKFHIGSIFGWRRIDGTRRFRRAYIEVARKNGKTTEGAAIANYVFFADRPREEGPEIYFAATKQEQAALGWREAQMQILAHPTLAKLAKVYESKQIITMRSTKAARMRPLGRDSKSEDGLNPHFALIDEYHAHPDGSLIEVLESGMGARRQPLTLIITTAGTNMMGPCYQQEHTMAIGILEGSIGVIPEDTFAIIYTLDQGDDWTDPDVWIKANPNLGVSVNPEYIESRVKLALASPAKQNDIKTKNLNVWTQAATRWITDERWLACKGSYTEDDLLGRRCVMAFDLSSTTDLTAIVLAFRPTKPGERWRFVYRFFMPEENLLEREREDKVPYTQWAEQGLIITTPGNIIDYDFIEQEICALGVRYVIDEIVYDPWKAQEIVNHLSSQFTMVQCAQRYNPMAPYSDTFEKKVLAREVEHDGNPIIRWMIACTEVKSDRQGNIMPMKPRRETTGKRIDGVVASVMALGRGVVLVEAEPSAYEERGLLTI